MRFFSVLVSATTDFPPNACFTVAIPLLRATGLPLARGTLSFYSCAFFKRCWATPRNQQGWFRSLKSVKTANEKDGRFTLPFKKGCKTRMLCHWPASQRSASQQCPAPHLAARSEYLALVFLLNSTTGFADAMRIAHYLDWVRLALPRPPNLDYVYL